MRGANMAKDYYKTLGIDRNATREEIKKAYKRLAKKHHPDLNKDDPDAADKFKEINEAASVLADQSKRQQYDQFGTTAEGFGGTAGGFDFRDFTGFGGAGFDFDEIFDRFFGGGFSESFGFGSRRRGPSRGSDLRYDLEIDLNEAAFGAGKSIIVPRLETCQNCKGTGARKASDVETCSKCNGSGHYKETRRTPFGIFSTVSTCRECNGQGKTIKHKCHECHGDGRVEKSRSIEISIPKGVHEGTRLRVAGEGEAGQSRASPGDLYVIISITPHEFFQRKGDDIYCEVPISFIQGVLGDEIEVPTLKGKAKLKIPAGTQTHTLFRMKGNGMPNMNGYGNGNQYCKVIVQVPKKLSKKQRDILDQFAKASGKETKPSKSFFAKLKGAF